MVPDRISGYLNFSNSDLFLPFGAANRQTWLLQLQEQELVEDVDKLSDVPLILMNENKAQDTTAI